MNSLPVQRIVLASSSEDGKDCIIHSVALRSSHTGTLVASANRLKTRQESFCNLPPVQAKLLGRSAADTHRTA
eukprot:4370866-Amphidinium_carterae.1